MKKSIIFLLLFEALNAQIEPKDIKSPNAASFERYGKYNVSLSNGTVDVNIPLHQMQLHGGGTLDLNLNFDTSGIKISQPAGSTGVNWSLQNPGMISRQINGTIDELKNISSVIKGHFFAYSDLNFPNIETQQGIQDFNNSISPGDSQDLQPDIFIFNFMGKTGKFFLGQDGTWKVQSEHNLKVIVEQNDFIRPFNYFPPQIDNKYYDGLVIGKITIIDDLGTQYIFGANQNSIEFTVGSFYSQRNELINSTAWYLNEVIDRTGKTLFSCSYTRGKPIARFYNNINNSVFLYKLLSGSLISPSYLSSIQTVDEEVIFNYSDRNDLGYGSIANLSDKFQRLKDNDGTTSLDPNWPDKLYFLYTNFNQVNPNIHNPAVYQNWGEASKLLVWNKLDKITIRTNNIIKKEIDFDYINKPSERLFLTKVSFKNNTYGQANEYEYKIKYNDGNDFEYNFDGSLPNYLWLGTNVFDSYSAVNENNNYCYISCNDGISDFTAKKGALLRLVYPTGGFTYFNFEQNSFSRFLAKANNSFILHVSSNEKTGGLRIKKIVNFPDINSVHRETISYHYNLYDNDNQSSGILSIDANLFTNADPYQNNLPWYSKYHLYGNGVKFSYNGPPVLYSRVIEERENQDGKQKTEYIFTNHDTANYYMDKPYIVAVVTVGFNIVDKYIDKSFSRGKLLSKKIYDSNNNLLTHSLFEYDWDNIENRYIRSFRYLQEPASLLKIYYGDLDLKKEIKKEYFNGKEIKTETTYNRTDYPYLNSGNSIFTGSRRLNSTVTSFADGSTSKDEIEYHFNCNSGGNCHDEIFALPKKIKEFKNSVLLSQNEFTYKPLNSNPKSLIIEEQKKTFFGSSTEAEKIKFTKYDGYGNLIEFQKENGNYVSLIMDSKGTKLLAKVENARYDELLPYMANIQKPYIANSTDAQNNIANPISYSNTKDIELRGYIASMKNSLPNTMITSYTYDSYNRLKTITQSNGLLEFYEYDSLGRLYKIKDSEGKVLKEYQYGYTTNNSGNYPYLLEEITNDEMKFPYLRNNCPVGQIGDLSYYTIPQGKYKSLISISDLSSQVFNDANQNGQNYVNLHGNCITLADWGLTALSTIHLYTSSLYLNGNTVSGYFVFVPISLNGQTGSYIARVPNNLIPTTERIVQYDEVNNGTIIRYWTFVIRTDGYITATVNGQPFNGSSISISSFQYQK